MSYASIEEIDPESTIEMLCGPGASNKCAFVTQNGEHVYINDPLMFWPDRSYKAKIHYVFADGVHGSGRSIITDTGRIRVRLDVNCIDYMRDFDQVEPFSLVPVTSFEVHIAEDDTDQDMSGSLFEDNFLEWPTTLPFLGKDIDYKKVTFVDDLANVFLPFDRKISMKRIGPMTAKAVVGIAKQTLCFNMEQTKRRLLGYDLGLPSDSFTNILDFNHPIIHAKYTGRGEGYGAYEFVMIINESLVSL